MSLKKADELRTFAAVAPVVFWHTWKNGEDESAQNALLAHRIEASGKRGTTELDKDEATYHCTYAPRSCTGTDEYLVVFQCKRSFGSSEAEY